MKCLTVESLNHVVTIKGMLLALGFAWKMKSIMPSAYKLITAHTIQVKLIE